MFELARLCAPSVVFLDEVQAIVGSGRDQGGDASTGNSRQLLTQLLLEFDSLRRLGAKTNAGSGICVLAATNEPAALDAALLMPGRFDVAIEVGLPSEAERVRAYLVWCDVCSRLREKKE